MRGRINATVFRVKVGDDEILTPTQPSPEGSQRIGYAVRLPGDDNSVSYRIPGMAQTNAGTLVAVYDIRYRHVRDLPADGKPWSTLIASKDQGKTWRTGTGVKSDTTEAQVIQLADGSIMINCRDNRGGSRTVAVTKNLGETWELHPTDRSALREPVCMASLLRWDHPDHGDLIFFSNPNTTRGHHNMTLKLSRDQALTWPESDARLYDSRACFGYSCLSIAGPDHIGVLYEGKSSMLYLRFPLDEWAE